MYKFRSLDYCFSWQNLCNVPTYELGERTIWILEPVYSELDLELHLDDIREDLFFGGFEGVVRIVYEYNGKTHQHDIEIFRTPENKSLTDEELFISAR